MYLVRFMVGRWRFELVLAFKVCKLLKSENGERSETAPEKVIFLETSHVVRLSASKVVNICTLSSFWDDVYTIPTLKIC